MGKLLLLFIGLPAVELALLIELGRRVGISATLGLILLTGLLGATLARRQGLRVVTAVQHELAEGRLPASSLLDGLLIVIASALLVTPGVLTDAVGFLCLYPGFRSLVKSHLRSRFERAVAEQRLHVNVQGVRLDSDPFETGSFGRGPIIDVTPDDKANLETDAPAENRPRGSAS